MITVDITGDTDMIYFSHEKRHGKGQPYGDVALDDIELHDQACHNYNNYTEGRGSMINQ